MFPANDVGAWKAFLPTTDSLPAEPFLVTADARTRYELTGKFIKRDCFDDFETSIWTASQAAEDNRRTSAISVLGAKGAGKSVFFRFFCHKHCSKRLMVYVPDAGTDANSIYRKLMAGLVFGLQCLGTEDAKELLTQVRSQSLEGTFTSFLALWRNWLNTYNDLCRNATVVIDQIQRAGVLFDSLRDNPIQCAAYILVSSTGILHHHNVSEVYKQLVYNYPVLPAELARFDGQKKLDNVGTITTMMGAISILENEPTVSHFQVAARKHFERVKSEKGYLKELLAVVQSEESGEEIDGGIWEKVLDPNYFWIGEDKMVKVADTEYMNEMRRLLRDEQVQYEEILKGLLSSQDIVNEVGNAALGVHVEALLDITWRKLTTISWKQQRKLEASRSRPTRSQQTKKVSAVSGEEFESIQPVCFDGDIPPKEELADLDWNKVVYFKPNRTNYAGFDMFILKKRSNRYCMHAIQVTVQDAARHSVEAFDPGLLRCWNKLLRTKCGSEPDWLFYMLTPEDDPPADPPSSSFDFHIYQVAFGDLIQSGDRDCGIDVVKNFPDLLKNKNGRKRQKT